jgi:hypothetical protein
MCGKNISGREKQTRIIKIGGLIPWSRALLQKLIVAYFQFIYMHKIKCIP